MKDKRGTNPNSRNGFKKGHGSYRPINKIKRFCLTCGKEFFVWPCFTRKGYSKFCSSLCYGISKKGKETNFKSGEEHPNWKGGEEFETKRRISTKEWETKRLEIIEKSENTCARCGNKFPTNKLQCHHKIPYRISRNDSVSNLEPLCVRCHAIKDFTFRYNENRVAVFTVVSDQYYYPVGTHKFINSFLKFHKDENIDLIVFRQDVIDKVFSEHGLNFYNARPTFAKLLVEKGYGLIVAIDADYAIFGRLDAVLADDYEVGCATNYNQFENRSVENVTEKEFVQAGLVASRNPKFWDIWERENKNAMKYVCKENDILSLIWKNDPEVTKMKQKVFDKDTPDFYGCKSLGQEEKFYLKDNKVWCGKGEVKAYHQARGAKFPKLDFFVKELGFTYEVADYWEKMSMKGVTTCLKGLT